LRKVGHNKIIKKSFTFQSKTYLLNLGRFHHHSGVPNTYFGVMGTIFLHAVRPYLEKHHIW
jgi:hypothetical protein